MTYYRNMWCHRRSYSAMSESDIGLTSEVNTWCHNQSNLLMFTLHLQWMDKLHRPNKAPKHLEMNSETANLTKSKPIIGFLSLLVQTKLSRHNNQTKTLFRGRLNTAQQNNNQTLLPKISINCCTNSTPQWRLRQLSMENKMFLNDWFAICNFVRSTNKHFPFSHFLLL